VIASQCVYLQNGRTPLHESVANGDVKTTQSLIAAGAIVDARSEDLSSPTDAACRGIIKEHAAILASLKADPRALVSALIVHCAAFATFKELAPVTAPSLHPYLQDPSISWAPYEARAATLAWARDLYIVQVAAVAQQFAELPDDCCSDILEHFELSMTRLELLRVVAHGLSLEAHKWVCSMFAEYVTVSMTILPVQYLDCSLFCDNYCVFSMS